MNKFIYSNEATAVEYGGGGESVSFSLIATGGVVVVFAVFVVERVINGGSVPKNSRGGMKSLSSIPCSISPLIQIVE